MRADLSSADLSEIRQSALGAADPLGVAAELADAVESGRLADPGDAGYALVLAAEIAESRSKIDAATRYVERALAAYGEADDERVGAARALHARVLFRAGRDDEAMAELEAVRPLLTRYPDAAAYLSAALAAGKRIPIAERWLTEAVQTALAERGQTAEPTTADDAGVLFFLLQQRHRIRHALDLPHDSHDNLADRLETRLANASARAAAEPELLFWPQDEFDQLVRQWPALSETYGKTWDEHRARVETELVRLAGTGAAELSLPRASVAALTRFAGADGDPADATTLSGYARQAATAAGRIPWPPERNAPCWCGSGAKYKKCCLPRSRS
ncbi:SEC-C domain-containing protein [Actinoplanes sp. N902-109]|uniref:SEC-C domain-containing protein n=1 Tax=Actinoplanes sp. (strain N902-109) TaxID=649831 RepID=UPI0003293AE9|nr:SEC-C domain-containing protein [Actinoplanes sp. N902-109]AGL15935.1 SEC-C domain-containing protein [Actinoplanes sp. N902-109]